MTVDVPCTKVPLCVQLAPVPLIVNVKVVAVRVPPAFNVILPIVWSAVNVILCPFCMIKTSAATRAAPFIGKPVSLVDQEPTVAKLPVATLE